MKPFLTTWVYTLISSLYVELLLCLPKICVFIFITLVAATSHANKSFFVHSLNYIRPVVLCWNKKIEVLFWNFFLHPVLHSSECFVLVNYFRLKRVTTTYSNSLKEESRYVGQYKFIHVLFMNTLKYIFQDN